MRKRNIKKQIWLDVKEDDLLKRKSKEAGLSEAEFIRSLVKGYRIKAQPTEEIKSFQRDLYGIANNINQIARVANSRYSVSHDDYKYISNTLADFILRFESIKYTNSKVYKINKYSNFAQFYILLNILFYFFVQK